MHPDRIYKQERNRLLKDDKKRCNTCNEIKALSEFRFRADRNKYAFECKLCRSNRAKEYDARTPDKAKVRRQRWLDKKLMEDPNYSHNQYIKHKEKHRIRGRIYYAENRKRLRAYSHQYYIENKDKVKAYQRKYHAKYPNKIKVRQREYYISHREEHIARTRRYQAENPDVVRASSAKRRSRKSGAGGSFTAQDWQALCEKHDNKCLCCGKKKPLTHDHIIPVSKGGSSNIENIQPLCKSCNSRKYTRIIDYRY